MAQTKVRFDRAVEGATNIVDSGTEGTKVAVGTTAQRGSTTGQWRYNSTTGKFEGRNASAFVAMEVDPAISSVSPTEVASGAGGNQTFTITGSNFFAGAVAKFVSNNGTTITASSTTVDSSTQITAVIAKSSFVNGQEPYDVKVVSAANKEGTLEDQINVDNAPTWTTASGNIADIQEDASGNHCTVAATDADGDTVSYSETGGSVLSSNNLTLDSSTGVISGNPTDVSSDTTHSFTLRATAGGKTADRAFNIIVRDYVFLGGNQAVDSMELMARNMLTASNTSVSSGGTLSINSNAIGNYEWYKTSGDTTLSSFSESTYYSGTADTVGSFLVFDGDLTIDSGVTIQPANRKLYTVLYVAGDLTVNGSIKMTSRGANHSGTTKQDIKMIDGTYSSVSNATIPASGGSGGAGKSGGAGAGSAGGTATRCAGGGGGGGKAGSTAGNGSAGTCFSGGAGGGGADNGNGGHGGANGGAGGNGGGANAGGGAGNPAGSGSGGHAAQHSGTGGTLLVYCTGTLSGSGSIEAKATDSGQPSGGYRGGGGAGGGIVQIFCNSGSISTSVAGGPGANSNGNEDGGAGGAGADDIYTGYSG